MSLSEDRATLEWRKKLYEFKNRTRNAGANHTRDFLLEVTERRILERLELSAGLSAEVVSEYAAQVYDMCVAEIDKTVESSEGVIVGEIDELDRKIKKAKYSNRGVNDPALAASVKHDVGQLLKKREALRRELKDLADKREKCKEALLQVFSDKDMSWSKKDPAKLEAELHQGLSLEAVSKMFGFVA